jgi:hypothetical protein
MVDGKGDPRMGQTQMQRPWIQNHRAYIFIATENNVCLTKCLHNFKSDDPSANTQIHK